MSMRRRSLLAAWVAAGLAAAACAGAIENAETGSRAAATGDSGQRDDADSALRDGPSEGAPSTGDPTIDCKLVGARCGAGCCLPLGGFRADTEKRCLIGTRLALLCDAFEPDCARSDALGCVIDETGGEPRVFVTSQLASALPAGWRRCPPSLEAEIGSYAECPDR